MSSDYCDACNVALYGRTVCCDSCVDALKKERDEARAEVETLRAAIDGEPWGAAVLKQQRDEAVKRLGITLEQLWATEKERDEARAEVKRLRFFEDCRGNGLTYECNLTRPCVTCRLRTVAERQREACAAHMYRHAPSTYADTVRATPLVTEEKP
jgi:hypothetical protein